MTWFSKKLKKIVGKEEEHTKFSFEVDIPAIYDFLVHVERDVEDLRKLVKTLQELHKEHEALTHDKKHENMRKQILIFDKIMNSYQYFEDDADINGSRIKNLREEFLRKAKHHHKELFEKFKNEPRWIEDW